MTISALTSKEPGSIKELAPNNRDTFLNLIEELGTALSQLDPGNPRNIAQLRQLLLRLNRFAQAPGYIVGRNGRPTNNALLLVRIYLLPAYHQIATPQLRQLINGLCRNLVEHGGFPRTSMLNLLARNQISSFEVFPAQ